MPVVKLIVLQLIAHLLYDFVFQPAEWSNNKKSSLFSAFHAYHVLIVFLFSYILSFDPGFWTGALVLAFLHLLTDMSKSFLHIKNRSRNLFFIDQVVHLISIVLVVVAYSRLYSINFIFELDLFILAVAAGFILCSKPSNVLIKNIFISFSIETPGDGHGIENDGGLPNAGKLIGISERYLALALIILGQYPAVGLIIAAKSILRLNSTQKSEYVLVGTLLSFAIAVFSGIIINLAR